MKISEMSRSQKRDFLESSYDAACDAHDDEPLPGGHPSRQIAQWAKLSQGRDGLPGNVGLAKPIENNPLEDGDPLAEADASSPVSPSAANRAHGHTEVDAALDEMRIRQRAGYNMDGELHLARVRRGNSTSASIAAMDKAIPGYARLK